MLFLVHIEQWASKYIEVTEPLRNSIHKLLAKSCTWLMLCFPTISSSGNPPLQLRDSADWHVCWVIGRVSLCLHSFHVVVSLCYCLVLAVGASKVPRPAVWTLRRGMPLLHSFAPCKKPWICHFCCLCKGLYGPYYTVRLHFCLGSRSQVAICDWVVTGLTVDWNHG